MKDNETILMLAATTPYQLCRITPIYWTCREMYWPKEIAEEKCIEILRSASELHISPDDSLTLQLMIDFELL